MWCHLSEAGTIKEKFQNQSHFSPGDICRKHLRRCDIFFEQILSLQELSGHFRPSCSKIDFFSWVRHQDQPRGSSHPRQRRVFVINEAQSENRSDCFCTQACLSVHLSSSPLWSCHWPQTTFHRWGAFKWMITRSGGMNNSDFSIPANLKQMLCISRQTFIFRCVFDSWIFRKAKALFLNFLTYCGSSNASAGDIMQVITLLLFLYEERLRRLELRPQCFTSGFTHASFSQLLDLLGLEIHYVSSLFILKKKKSYLTPCWN